jgi:hypothetical protein
MAFSTDEIIKLLTENYALVIGAVVTIFIITFLRGGRRHPLEPPYAYRGIPILGNFIEFAKGMHALI